MSAELYEIVNPATEEVVTTLELTTLEEADRAIERAAAAFPAWRAVAPGDRARLLRRFADLVDASVEGSRTWCTVPIPSPIRTARTPAAAPSR